MLVSFKVGLERSSHKVKKVLVMRAIIAQIVVVVRRRVCVFTRVSYCIKGLGNIECNVLSFIMKFKRFVPDMSKKYDRRQKRQSFSIERL